MAPRGVVKKRPAAATFVDEAEEELNEEYPGTPDPPTPVDKRGRGRGRGRGVSSPSNADRHSSIQGSPTSASSTKGGKADVEHLIVYEESPKTAAARAMQVSAPEKRWESPLKKRPLSPPRLQVVYTPPEGGTAPPVCSGLVALRNSGSLCDAVVLAGEGRRVPVHRVVLAANSDVFGKRLEGEAGELDLKTCSCEAADLFVRWLYGEVNATSYAPSSEQVNEEVLRLSSEFQLLQLSEVCALYLATNVETKNVVDRIRLCEDFALPRLRAALVSSLCEDRHVLDSVARDPHTLSHPALMRELLASIAQQANSRN